MKMNRVQFQAGLSMAEFMNRYGSDDKCEAALIESRWPSGFDCPACGCGHSSSFRREGRLYFQCTACRHQCSVISGTIFEATKLGLSRSASVDNGDGGEGAEGEAHGGGTGRTSNFER